MRFLTLEDFQPHVGTVFVGQLADSEVPFQLVEVQPLQSSAGAQQYRQPFSLVFRNESAVLFPQQIYSMRHPGMGEQAIFVVPVARDASGFLYQAVFN
ncbi:hypothetical protein HNP33_000130 [Comamonas odontotermitis]|uniref:DUF6916 domain-containing protein n=1 Tax=Comamonas odontotermitis TaxID=379895 RepID=A0ABR6RA98_9BURK|nr:hypothetical protein [Comamonas odontotermitis]MBB6576082.1 hypothetical protein [Comamonas odontotermitis]